MPNVSCQGDPASVPPHELDDEHAVVAFGGGVKLIQRLHRSRDRRIKANRDLCPVQIINRMRKL